MLVLVALAFADPVATLRAEGCLACHDAGAAVLVGPPLGTLPRTDRDYLLESLVNPGAVIREGFPAGLMPAVDPVRAEALLPVLAELNPDSGAARGTLPPLILAALGFCFGHLGLSSPPVRTPLVRRFGELGFMGLYSIVITAALVALLWTWSRAPYVPLWTPVPWTRWVPLIVMPFVMIAQIAGYSTASPTMAGMGVTAEPRGILRITRHPVNISSSIWALAHLVPNGDVASVCLFGSVAILGVLGSLHIDRRRAAANGAAWDRFAAQTSVIPFVAILQGRTRLDLGELGWWRVLGGLAAFAGALLAHNWLMGASPYPT